MFNSRFDKLNEVKSNTEIKRLQSRQKAEAYLEPKRISTMEPFREYT